MKSDIPELPSKKPFLPFDKSTKALHPSHKQTSQHSTTSLIFPSDKNTPSKGNASATKKVINVSIDLVRDAQMPVNDCAVDEPVIKKGGVGKHQSHG